MHGISSVNSSLVKISHTSKVLKVSFGETMWIQVSHSCRNQSRDYKIAQSMATDYSNLSIQIMTQTVSLDI